MKILPGFPTSAACLIVAVASSFAQQPAPGGFFTLINTVPKSTGFKCYIANSKETNVIVAGGSAADEAAGNGYSTGLIPWAPADGVLTAEAPGRGAAQIKSFLKPGETPLVILKPKGSGALDFSLLPKPVDRNGGFYDAVNLTDKFELEVSVDGKKVLLPRGQRVRLGKNKTLNYEVEGGPKDLLESVDDPSHVVVFYAGDDGKVRCAVVADYAL